MSATMPSARRNRAPLQPAALYPLPVGAIRPRGWLRDQLRIQADGLTGHLEEFWPDLGPDNMWLGGKAEGWERGPYYVDGLVPLAHLLRDERLLTRAKRWTDAFLEAARPDGWIGPIEAPGQQAFDQWPVTIALKALTQHQEATGDPRVIPAMAGFFRYLADTLDDRPLFEWGRHRWADLVLSIHWLYDRTGDPDLLPVAARIAEQGYPWRAHFEDFRYTKKVTPEQISLDTHVVNNAMAVKTGGIWWRQSGDPGDRDLPYRTMDLLDRYHGQVTGVFAGDEHYAGPSPTQGTELCAVVEYMYSLECLLSVYGDPTLADRLERIAFNALPGTFTDDMWAHQYDQQANQVLVNVAHRAWTNNADDSNVYGLEPNFGCCTANFHQGWPKLACSLWMQTPDNGLAMTAIAPCEVTTALAGGIPVRVTVDTGYPFRSSASIEVAPSEPVRFPLLLRIPGWTRDARARLEGSETRDLDVEAGTFLRIEREWRKGDVVRLDGLCGPVRVEHRHRGAAAVHRNPLVFSLRIGESVRPIKGTPPQADYEASPTTPWNYGLILQGADPFTVREGPIGPKPFAAETAPVVIAAHARRVPSWGMEENSTAPVPEGVAPSTEPIEEVELIPYGSTILRVTEFPEVAP